MKPKTQFDRKPALKWAVILALLVFALFALAEAVHFHPGTLAQGSSNAPESGCPLCMAAHSAAAPIQVSATPVLALAFAPAYRSEPQLQSRLFVPIASIRPPPAA
jgi:hypothetical protein